jgi:hypothetical protein
MVDLSAMVREQNGATLDYRFAAAKAVGRGFRNGMQRQPRRKSGYGKGRYFLTGVGMDDFPWAPPNGTAGVTGLVLSFLGFFCSRLLRTCPLAIQILLKV